MKKSALIVLCAVLALTAAVRTSAGEEKPLYTALMRYSTGIYDKPEGTQSLGSVSKGQRVNIYEVLPAWLRIERNGVRGYIHRKFLDDYTVDTVDPAAAPAYPGVQNLYLGVLKEDTGIMAAPGADAEELLPLGKGTRLSFIGMENGWAKLIFKRQYGYVDTRCIEELIPFDDEGIRAPLAAYTSFYNVATTENNLSRIKNLEVSCEKFSKLTIAPGANFDFNRDLGPYRPSNGYFPAIVLIAGGSKLGYGGGTCQASSTLYNVVLQLPGLHVDYRRPHGPGGASYLPHGADAAVGNTTQNFVFTNNYPFPVRIEGTAQDGALTIAIWKAE